MSTVGAQNASLGFVAAFAVTTVARIEHRRRSECQSGATGIHLLAGSGVCEKNGVRFVDKVELRPEVLERITSIKLPPVPPKSMLMVFSQCFRSAKKTVLSVLACCERRHPTFRRGAQGVIKSGEECAKTQFTSMSHGRFEHRFFRRHRAGFAIVVCIDELPDTLQQVSRAVFSLPNKGPRNPNKDLEKHVVARTCSLVSIGYVLMCLSRKHRGMPILGASLHGSKTRAPVFVTHAT